MFCSNCGNEIQEEWINCPNCGVALKNVENKKEEINNNDYKEEVSKPRSRDDIKAELIGQAFSEKGGVVIFYGAGGISRDMARVLNPNEKMLSFYHAHRSSILGQMKGSRMFRSYIVCTDQRFIYIESGRMSFSLIPFFRKTVSVPYQDITNVSTDKRLGIYSGKIMIESSNKKISLAMLDNDDAMKLEEFLKSKNTR